MDVREQREKEIAGIVNIVQGYGFSGQQSMLDVLCRVVQTRAAAGEGDDADALYRRMRKAAPSLPPFPGGAELFHTLYKLLAPLSGRDILACISASGAGREMRVPDVLVREFAGHITGGVHSVLVPECERYGAGLLDLVQENPAVSFTLTCRQDLPYTLLSAVYTQDNVKIQRADVCTFGFTAEKFDLILSVPAFGGRMLINDEDFISREPDLIAAQNLLYHINMEGELVIVLPAKITFAGGSAASLRRYIERSYRIKEISALPAGLFAPFTAIRSYLFVFSTGTTDDVVLKQYVSDRPIRRTVPCRALTVKNELLLFSDEFEALSGWNIEMAFSEEDEDIKAFAESRVRKLCLKDAAVVFRGKAVSGRSKNGNIGVVNISDITDAGIDYAGLDLIEEEEHKVARYALQEGDVLVTARGTTVKTAVYEAQPMVCIPSANINVIRPREMLKGAYLKLFLDSPAGVKLLRSLQRGSGVVNINFKDMNELEVPILPLETQEALIQEYSDGLKFYRDTIEAAEEGWQNLRREIQLKLF